MVYKVYDFIKPGTHHFLVTGCNVLHVMLFKNATKLKYIYIHVAVIRYSSNFSLDWLK